MRMIYVTVLALSVGLAGSVRALDVGSDGTDGALVVSVNDTLDLSLATTGTWNDPSIGVGNGIYDPEKWAVVYHFTSVTINASKTLYFKNHPSGAPVVWLVQGNVTISGTVKLNGGAATGDLTFSVPGPGGFRGGRGYGASTRASAGLGPGGGGFGGISQLGCGGGYATPGTGINPGATYGNSRILPLIGGSGGSGSDASATGGGAGGGAILIAANETITILSVNSLIQANGGGAAWFGSGGAIRLIANHIEGYPMLYAIGTSSGSGLGRIRLEANSTNLIGNSTPPYSLMMPLENNVADIWPPADEPRLRVTTFNGLPVPADPHSQFVGPGDVTIGDHGPVSAVLEARCVPLNWSLTARVVPRTGAEYLRTATWVDGDSALSHWTIALDPLPDHEYVAIQAKATKP